MTRLFGFILLLCSQVAVAGYGPYRADVVRVLDGDTVEADVQIWPGLVTRVKVRLAGVNAPETRTRDACEKAAGVQAKARLSELLSGAAVAVDQVRRGKYAGRVLAVIYADGADVGSVLLREGLVRRYSGGRREPWCSP